MGSSESNRSDIKISLEILRLRKKNFFSLLLLKSRLRLGKLMLIEERKFCFLMRSSLMVKVNVNGSLSFSIFSSIHKKGLQMIDIKIMKASGAWKVVSSVWISSIEGRCRWRRRWWRNKREGNLSFHHVTSIKKCFNEINPIFRIHLRNIKKKFMRRTNSIHIPQSLNLLIGIW